MIKLENSRQIIFGFLIVATIFFLYSDPIVIYIAKQHPIITLFLASFLDPIYILFVCSLYKLYGLRGVIAGFLFTVASTLISLPHVILRTGALSQESFDLVGDVIFYKLVPSSLKSFSISIPVIGSVNFGVFLVYIVISSGLVLLGLAIGKKKKVREIFMKTVNGG